MTNLRRRLEKLEASSAGPEADPLATVTGEEWAALAILHHEMAHPPGAPLTDEVWAELERRMRAGGQS